MHDFFPSLQVIVNDLGEDTEAHAAKLIEVVILQCQENTIVVCLMYFKGFNSFLFIL